MLDDLPWNEELMQRLIDDEEDLLGIMEAHATLREELLTELSGMGFSND